jgi:threonine synthase
MSGRFTLRCIACGAQPASAFATSCSQCGGLVDAFYPLDRAKLGTSDNPYLRYLDLLPVRDPGLLPEAGMTRTIHARALGKRFGLRHLYLKDETANPTGTTKDRMAAVALPFLYEAGVRHFCASSTGNSSTAYAQAIGRIADMRMELFTAEDFHDRVHYRPSSQLRHHVLRGASFVEAADQSAVHAREHGLVAEGGFFNPGRREGRKVAWLEAIEQVPGPIEWYVQASSSAMGVYGVYKGAKEAAALGWSERAPRLLCAQQMSCRPMVHAWEEDAESIRPHHIVARPSGIAEAILRGNPTKAYPHIRRIVLESGGTMLAVDEQEIRAAQALVLEDEGVSICPAAGTAVAALLKLARTRADLAEARILVNLTGSLRERQPVAPVDHWLERIESGWAQAA